MRFIHISDLHIGKKLKEASLEEDQRHILSQILGVVRDLSPDAVLIAGDVYDTPTPSAESVTILDGFLTELTGLTRVYMISGNHDSPERLGFGSRMLEGRGLFISGVYSGSLDVHTLTVGDETVDVCLLPFIKPVVARRAHPEDPIEDYTDAVRSAISHTELSDDGRMRVLVTHQYVVSGDDSPEGCDSESLFVGGTEAVDVSVFDGFDYVALGHLHRPQWVGRETVRYCGTPLKYSASEADDAKSVTVVDLGEDGVAVSTVPLRPMRDVRRIRGPLDAIVSAARGDGRSEDFVYVTLEAERPDALARLREVYPNVLSIETAGDDRGPEEAAAAEEGLWDLDPLEAFAEFYRAKKGKELTENMRRIVSETLEGIE